MRTTQERVGMVRLYCKFENAREVVRSENDPRLPDKICWSDESQFRLDGQVNRHNCTYWATANPELQIEIPTASKVSRFGAE
jgi:hypothetical protein